MSTIAGSAPVEVDIVLYDVENLYGAQIEAAFDPALVQVDDADTELPGTQLSPGAVFGNNVGFVALNRVNNLQGKIEFAATLLNPASPLSGQVTLATCSLKAVQAGSVTLRFNQVLLADRAGQPMQAAQGDVTLTTKP